MLAPGAVGPRGQGGIILAASVAVVNAKGMGNSEELESMQRYLRSWFSGALGSKVLEAERARLSRVLPDLFGYHALQLGGIDEADLLGSSRILHRIVAGVPGSAAHVQAEPEHLPVASDSVDVLLLPHTLEFCREPHQVLREADRILIPEGHLVILGFNPWSLWPLRRVIRGQGEPPWRGRFLSVTRVRDWLGLLGFETLGVDNFFFRPPCGREAIMRRLQSMEQLGERGWPVPSGLYLLTARKRVVTLTPIRPRWRPRRRVVGTRAPEPTLRS
jgi:SAM-dependent methyltransferase